MVKAKLIEETLLLAQKYNDFIEENQLRFTKFNISSLEFELNQRTKRQVGDKSQEVLEMFNYLKDRVS